MNAVNTIFWNNGDVEFSPLPNNNQLNLDFNYSNAEDIWPGVENINFDPIFENTNNSDYTLSQASPCIDAGTTDINMDGTPDIEYYAGSSPDIGVFEYTGSCSEIPGDFNQDGNTNILDIINVANCILASNCDECTDLNSDGEVNILDIITLVNIILYLH